MSKCRVKTKTYHIGICKGGGFNGHKPDTLIVQARRSVDFLSCELWEYYGERQTTKALLKRRSGQLLEAFNREHGTAFIRIVID